MWFVFNSLIFVAPALAWATCACKFPSVRSAGRQQLPWVPCERNSSYSFVPIFLKLCSVFLMVWGCACSLSLFPQCELSHFSTSNSMYRQWVPCECNSPYNFIPVFLNFAHVFSMVWRCACGLNIMLELTFITFSTL